MRQRPWLVKLLMAALLLALMGTLFPRLLGMVGAAESELAQALDRRRGEVRTLRALQARRGELAARLEKAEAALESLKAQLEKGQRQPFFLNYLETGAVNAGVVITALTFDPPQPAVAARSGEAAAAGQEKQAAPPAPTGQPAAAAQVLPLRYPVTLRAHGPYPGVAKLVGHLEEVFPLVSVDSVAITTPPVAKDGKRVLPAGWVQMEIRLSVLALADSTSSWARELADLAQGLGRHNPFEAPASGK